MNVNSLPSERFAPVASIDPDAYTATTYTSGWVAVKNFHHFLAVFQAGDLGSSATLDGKLEKATDSGGTGATDVTGSAITQLTQAGTDSNKQAVVNLDTASFEGSAYTHIRLSMTVGTATSDAAAILFGVGPRDGIASDNDDTAVDSITTVR